MSRTLFLYIIAVLVPSIQVFGQSAIAVEIKTNINTIACEVADTSITTSKGHLKKGFAITIPVEELGCPSGVTNDLIAHLNAKEYPNIKFIVCDIGYDTAITSQPNLLQVDVQVADKLVTYAFNVTVVEKNNTDYLTGTLGLQLADFNIEPPTKMMGLVKVKDRIEIFFSLPMIS